MATIDGAKAMGLGSEIGSLEVGKRADVIVVKLQSLHSTPHLTDDISSIVYSSQPADVDTVIIDGRLVMSEGQLLSIDERLLIKEANREAELLMMRAGLSEAIG